MRLTKQDIDKVRHIEGFPIAKDEDIIALSRPPHYTACPNPFLEDFIKEHGTPYDEATDDYHREPFAADVSEGKNDPIYNAHSYHTKVPYKAIMRYILHYTKPGDIVFDGFCGTGMTGVAAQMCGRPNPEFKCQLETEMDNSDILWGARKTILSDLSPAATFIAYNYNTTLDVDTFEKEAKHILAACEKELGWMYETQHLDERGKPVLGLDGKPIKGRINYTVWSDVFVCPSCTKELVYWDVAADINNGILRDNFTCSQCNGSLKKNDCERVYITEHDPIAQETLRVAKQIPVYISYIINGKRYTKRPDIYDMEVLKRAESMSVSKQDIPFLQWKDGDKTGEPIRMGFKYIYQIYTRKNIIFLAHLYRKIIEADSENVNLLTLITSVGNRNLTKCNRFVINKYNPQGRVNGPMPGTLYIPSLVVEQNPSELIGYKVDDLKNMFNEDFSIGNVHLSTQTTATVPQLADNCIDYIFTDPPFGYNITYSDLNSVNESWLHVLTNDNGEAIISPKQHKALVDYQNIMEQCFREYFRTLKPKRWITVEFHNSQNSVWNAIQEALMRSGFIVADVRTLDKQGGSINQDNSRGAVKQDLVISAYKPKDSFIRDFQQYAGNAEMVWEFVRQHLEKVPITTDAKKDGMLDIIAERCDYLLFDRMVAYHIMHGISVPMDAHTFYEGLRNRFLERDGMFFLPDQVTAYDEKRLHMKLDTTQFSFVVTDEKNAIQWLNYILRDKPQTYQDIQPQYLQELHQDKREQMPELMDMLKDNFLQDDQGRFYIPDLSKAADLAKLRTKKLLKEFYDSFVPGKAKLKAFRMEAIRAGFDDCWNKRDYKTIINVGERLPEAVLQEDPALLMYYDNACVRN